MNITLVRQDECVEEVNITLGEVTIGRGPLLSVSTVNKMKARKIEFSLDKLMYTDLGSRSVTLPSKHGTSASLRTPIIFCGRTAQVRIS